MLKKLLKNYLDIKALEERVGLLEKDTERQLKHFGDYKNRTDKELDLMGKQVNDALEAIDSLIRQGEYKNDMPRVKNLMKRLRNNKTRIENALHQTG